MPSVLRVDGLGSVRPVRKCRRRHLLRSCSSPTVSSVIHVVYLPEFRYDRTKILWNFTTRKWRKKKKKPDNTFLAKYWWSVRVVFNANDAKTISPDSAGTPRAFRRQGKVFSTILMSLLIRVSFEYSSLPCDSRSQHRNRVSRSLLTVRRARQPPTTVHENTYEYFSFFFFLTPP